MVTQSEIINKNFKQLQEENKVNNAYITGQVSTEKKMFEQVKEMKRSTFDRSKFTVVGTPTIADDGIASGFTTSNYVYSQPFTLGTKTWKVQCKFKSETNLTGTPRIIMSCKGANSNWYSRLGIWYGTGDWFTAQVMTTNDGKAQWDYKTTPNTDYTVIIEYTGTQYKITINGETRTFDNANPMIYYQDELVMQLGGYHDSTRHYAGFLGSIDLKQFLITVDDVEVFNGNKTGIDQIKADNFTKIGNPVITDNGVVSGFSGDNYLSFTSPNLTYSNDWEILTPVFKITSTQVVQSILAIGTTSRIFILAGTNNTITIAIQMDSGDTNIYRVNSIPYALNTSYQIKIKHTSNGAYSTYLKTENGDFIQYGTSVVDTTHHFNTNGLMARIGYATNDYFPFYYGSIDLNSFKIYVDGNLVYQPTLRIPYTLSKTGSKIVDSVYRDRVQDVYEQNGVAQYYTLSDTDVTLPMGEIYGMFGKDITTLNEQVSKLDEWVYRQDGTSGYRYNTSNGYCEQCGVSESIANNTTSEITLLKQYKDMNFIVICQSKNASNQQLGGACPSSLAYPSNNNKFKINAGSYSGQSGNLTYSWLTIGYLAEGEY